MPRSPVSLHPYFKAKAGQLEAALALLPRFVERTATETKVLWYEFTQQGDEVFCREGYEDAEGTLAHLQNVEALLKEMLEHCTLERLEVHGPAEELEQLKGPLGALQPAWFVRVAGLER